MSPPSLHTCRSKTQVRQTSLEVHVLFLEHTARQRSAVNPCATERAGAVLRSIRHRKRSEPVPARFDRLNRLCTENGRLGSRSTSTSKVTLFQMIYTIKLGTGPTSNINRWEQGTATKLHFFSESLGFAMTPAGGGLIKFDTRIDSLKAMSLPRRHRRQRQRPPHRTDVVDDEVVYFWVFVIVSHFSSLGIRRR